MRNSFSDVLVEAANSDPRIYLLTGDHGYALFDSLRKKCPAKYINAGVAEQNMVGVAAGLAKTGLLPIVYGLASFIPIRVLEQIKLDICFEKLPVVLIGDGAGVVYSNLGVSHQCFEDIAAVRALPNLRVFSPCDKYEMKLCLENALLIKGPTYIRIGKSDLGSIHARNDFADVPGIHEVIKAQGSSPVILATGSMVKVAQQLIEKEFSGFGLYSVLGIKPFDQNAFLKFTKNSKMIITMEEHSVLGGLGSIVSEVVTSSIPKKVLRLGIENRFTDKCGTYEFIMREHGLDEKTLINKIKLQI
jgi:transketolase